ncbi:MAG: hypothetical protein J2P21_18510 [Chloracidobacterium sp.]|nr:hypothetical protein [Chloracidobacterium sp.]
MDILESLEVRWFLPSGGSVGAALESWFGSTEGEGKRIDHYLSTGRYDLNFKARLEEGKPAKVETKYLVGSLGVVDLATKISGELQRWTKLSLALNDPKLKQHGAWLEVTKTRQLRKYAITMTPAPGVKEVSLSDFPPIGCGVELTRLDYEIKGTAYVEQTFGLEAFGPKSQLLDVMQAAIRAHSPGLPELRAEWTASYATWLLARIA